jgi:hypothetical protein
MQERRGCASVVCLFTEGDIFNHTFTVFYIADLAISGRTDHQGSRSSLKYARSACTKRQLHCKTPGRFIPHRSRRMKCRDYKSNLWEDTTSQDAGVWHRPYPYGIRSASVDLPFPRRSSWSWVASTGQLLAAESLSGIRTIRINAALPGPHLVS